MMDHMDQEPLDFAAALTLLKKARAELVIARAAANSWKTDLLRLEAKAAKPEVGSSRKVLELGFLNERDVMKIAREQRMPKFMYDTEQARMALAIFAQNVRRRDAAEPLPQVRSEE